MASTLTVDGVVYTYEVQAEAGVFLSSGERWWGTRIKWRAGTKGKWHSLLVPELHPFDDDVVADALTTYLWLLPGRKAST